MTTIWKINSERIAKRHGRNTFDKLSYAEAKKIGFSYCIPYTNKEAMKRRCPNAKQIGVGFIEGQRFKFNNVSRRSATRWQEV